MDDFQKKLEEQQNNDKAEQDKQAQLDAVTGTGSNIIDTLKSNNDELKGSIHDLLLATLVSKDPKIFQEYIKVARELSNLLGAINLATGNVQGANFKPLSDNLKELQQTLLDVPNQIKSANESTDPTPHLQAIAKTLGEKNFSPKLSVPALDLSPLTKILTDIKTALSDEKEPDNSKLEDLTQQVANGVSSVESAISGLKFPTANYILPFKDVNGKAVQVQLDASGNVPTSGGGGGGSSVTIVGPLGQSLAAASIPVVLTAAQITTLTPPAAITNYAQETGGNLATLAGTVTSAVLQENVKQINGVAPLMGNGVTGTGSQRVTIASDNTAFSVNATLSAETTKVIGVVRNADGSGNLLTSTTGALDVNLKTSALSNQSVNVAQINGVTPLMGNGVTGTGSQRVTIASDNTAFSVNATLSAETTKVIGTVNQGTSPWVVSLTSTTITGTVTVAGGKTNNNAAPGATNIGALIGIANAAAPTYTEGDQVLSSLDLAGNTRVILNAETTKVIGVTRTADGSGNLITSTANALDVNIKSGFGTSITANQGTAAALSGGWPVINGEAADVTGTFTNATQTTSVTASSLDGYGNVLISITGTYGTATAVFEGSDDGGTTWFGISEADRTDSNIIESGYTSLTNTLRAWQISNPGWDSVRVRSTAVASGTVNVRISPSAAPTSAGASVSIGTALPTGANVIGAVTQSGTWTDTVTQATAANLNATVVGTGTFAVQATLSAETTKVIGTVNQGTSPWVVGQSTAASLNATVVGTGTFLVQTSAQVPGTGATNLGKAEDAASASGDTGVLTLGVRNDTIADSTNANGDYTQFSTDVKGHIMTANAPRLLKVQQQTALTASTAETTVLTAVASTFLDVYGVIVANSSATASNITFKDSTAGTTRFNVYVPAGDTRGFMLPVDAALDQAAVNTNWTATSSNSVTSILITMLAVKNI